MTRLIATPKATSEAFAALKTRIQGMFPGSALGVMADGVLDRRGMEKLLLRQRAAREQQVKSLSRPALVAHVIAAYQASDDGAYALLKELDSATAAHRNLVASIPEGEAKERLLGHRALLLHRHGARLLWAVVRDERPALLNVAATMAEEFLANLQRIDRLREAAQADGAEREFLGFEKLMEELGARLHRLESAVSSAEQERARLLVEQAKREARLRKEREERQSAEARLKKLEAQMAKSTSAVPPRSRSASQDESLRQRIAALEAQHAADKTRLAAQEEENLRLRQRLDAVRDELASARQQRTRVPAPLETEKSGPGPLVASPKKHRARKGQAAGGDALRWGVFLDAANLAGAARRLHQSKIDFGAVLSHVARGRRLACAKAFVIDKGAAGFDGFVQSLRGVGFEVSAKQPKRFADGTVKADWDVGIVVDVLSRCGSLDGVVLGSGDGDFVPLVAALKARGIAVEVVSFVERSDRELLQAADYHHALGAEVLMD